MRRGRRHWKGAALAGALWLSTGFALAACVGESGHERPFHSAAGTDSSDTESEAHEVEIRTGRRLGYLDQEVETPTGTRTVGVRCSTCHDGMVKGPMVERIGQVRSFHSDMSVAHGDLRCNSCHANDDRDLLKMADGRRISFERTMELCGQCHGPQLRDYRHGAHGGMTGHWDLREGPRQRNHCVNCHDPHVPDYPVVQPAPPPRDRSMSKPERHPHESETGGSSHE